MIYSSEKRGKILAKKNRALKARFFYFAINYFFKTESKNFPFS